MSGLGLQVSLLFILILMNGILAMAEIAVVSARKARLEQRSRQGDQKAARALELAENPTDFLSTVQIGITLVGILAGAFGGATIAENLEPVLAQVNVIARYSEAISVGLVVILTTYLTLVVGELAPKRLALLNPERISIMVAGPMQFLARLSHPFVRLLSISTGLVLRLLGAQTSDEPPVTEEEIRVLIEQGTVAGVFEEAEQEMVAGVFRLADRRVDSLMTPRTEIYWLDLEDGEDVNRQRIIDSSYSRLPVGQDDLDHIRGLVQAKSLLARCLEGEPLDLEGVIIPAQFVPESAPALSVLEIFRRSGVHMALVIDEFGGLQGLVTVMDILESIVGEIPGREMDEEPEVVQREDGSWLIDGLLPMDEFQEIFLQDGLPEEEKGYYQTVGGLVMVRLGRIPHAGDHFEWRNLRFEVVDMDRFRVDKVLVLPLENT